MLDQTVEKDIFDQAEEVTLRAPEYWGQVQIDMYYAALIKGVGKVPFDPGQHALDKRVMAIEVAILPIAEQNVKFDVRRDLIAESREWAGIVLPSIKALRIKVKELPGKWVKVTFKNTGASYTNKNGEKKDKTTLEFLKIFDSEDACKLDYLTRSGEPTAASAADFPKTDQTVSVDLNNEKKTALAFAKALVANATRKHTGDLDGIRAELTGLIATMPMVNKYYTVDSPEIMQMIAEEMSR